MVGRLSWVFFILFLLSGSASAHDKIISYRDATSAFAGGILQGCLPVYESLLQNTAANYDGAKGRKLDAAFEAAGFRPGAWLLDLAIAMTGKGGSYNPFEAVMADGKPSPVLLVFGGGRISCKVAAINAIAAEAQLVQALSREDSKWIPLRAFPGRNDVLRFALAIDDTEIALSITIVRGLDPEKSKFLLTATAEILPIAKKQIELQRLK
jgi:hypothetical protein